MKNVAPKILNKAAAQSQFKIVCRKTTKEIFEEFYGKPYEKITAEDIGNCEEIDFGDEVGGEIIK